MLRLFEGRDYARLAAIGAAIDPSHTRSAEWYERRDAARQAGERHYRLVAEEEGLVVGWGEVGHMWWGFHPRKFGLWINVEPAKQGRRIGARLYEALFQELQTWDPLTLRADTRETRPRSIRFLQDRGFVAVHRRWELHLKLSEARMLEEPDLGHVRIATLVQARQQNAEIVRRLYELEDLVAHDEPATDPDTTMQFEHFVANEIDSPNALPEGVFLAFDGDELVGVSRLSRAEAQWGVLHVGFTGVHPSYRGRGVAMALKLRTIAFAQRSGFAEIRTQNEITNAPMLHINKQLGFETAPAFLIFEKRFTD